MESVDASSVLLLNDESSQPLHDFTEPDHAVATSLNLLGSKRPRINSAVDLLFLKRLFSLLKLMIPKVVSKEMAYLLILVLVVLGNEALVYFVGLLPSHLITGLVKKDSDAFFNVLWKAALFTIGEAVILSVIGFLSGLLALKWRQHLVGTIHTKYLDGMNFYALNQFYGKSVDNPDQRIVEDANLLCTTLAKIFQSSAVPAVIIFYTQQGRKVFGVGFFLSPHTLLVAQMMGWMGPVAIYSYFIIGSIINKFLMSRVSEIVWKQEKLEGSFRFGHARLRSNSEQIALYRGGVHERLVLNASFLEVLDNGMVLLRRRFALDVSQNSFSYIGGFLSYVVVGLAMQYGGAFKHLDPADFAGQLQKASFLSIMLISAFSQIVNLR